MPGLSRHRMKAVWEHSVVALLHAVERFCTLGGSMVPKSCQGDGRCLLWLAALLQSADNALHMHGCTPGARF